MFRIINLKTLLTSVNELQTNFANLQSIRWRRKPRWLPVAKSKLFRIPPRTVTPENERMELIRLFNNYRTQMKAIRSYLHSEYNIESVVIDTEAHEKQFMEDFIACSKINDEWNEKQRVIREARHEKELEALRDIAYNKIDEQIQKKKERFEISEEIVRKEKVASKTFITSENIDAAIEHALANITDYNYAIDLEGKYYRKSQSLEEKTN